MTHSSRIVLGGVGLAALVVAAGGLAATGGRQGFPKPALPTEPVEVRGAVAVTALPAVDARQAGPWTVAAAQAGPWTVRVSDPVPTAPLVPSFLQREGTYRFRWPDGATESFRVLDLRPDGWVWGEPVDGTAPPRRWINPAHAVTITPLGR